MKRALYLIVLASLLLALSACGSAGGNTAASADAAPQSPSAAAEGGETFPAAPQEAESQPLSQPEAAGGAGSNAKLIRQADLTVQTETFDSAAAALEALVAECGGYFQSAQVEGGSLRNQSATRYGEYVVRLPEARFSFFLDQSGTLGYVTRRSESSENVSQAYADTETRLETQRIKQERLLALLEQADTMESILELENALSDTEYEIQSLKVDLEHYDDLIDYATITVTLEEVLQLEQNPGETAGLGARLSAGLSASVRGVVQGVQDLLVWLSYNLFLVLVLAALAAGGALVWRRFRSKQDKSSPK